MPVVNCPKCPTKLKIPDGVSGNTKCPKCSTVFPVASAPAFEVVDAPAPAPKPAAPRPAAQPAPKPAPKPAAIEPDFEVLDEKPKKRVTSDDDDDDDDDRPRKKKRRDDEDDEDDDEPRGRKKRGGKARKKRRYEDDDEDDWQPRRGGGGEFAKAKSGAMLIGVSFWLNLGTYGLLALYALIAWVMVNGSSSGSSSSSSSSSRGSSSGDSDGSFMDVMVILPGLIGLGAWIVGTVGSSIAIAGPRKSRGMAITATVFAGLHLVLTAVTFSNLQDGLGGFGRSLPGVGKVGWIVVASTLPVLDTFVPTLFYASRGITSDYAFALLAAVCEAGRLVFMLLTLKALAAAARDYDSAEKTQISLLTAVSIVGGVALLTLLMAVLLRECGFKSIGTYLNLGVATVFLMYLAYTFMMLGPALAAMQTKDACARRT